MAAEGRKKYFTSFSPYSFPSPSFFYDENISPIHDIRITHTTYNTRDFLCGESVMHDEEKKT